MTEDPSLARRVDAAQSILASRAATEALRLEAALARCCQEFAVEMRKQSPGSGASSLALPAGVAIFAGAGSPVTQGLAMGLHGPVTAPDLDAVESHLRPSGVGAVSRSGGRLI